MGFLKRIFSMKSKKSKKQRPAIVHNVPINPNLRTIEEEEHEAAVGRLLRSSSTRFAVVAETDYNSVPPLPHPINEIFNTPGASTMSIASSTISQRGTYSVKVHGRKRHTSTEFPNANRDLEDHHVVSPNDNPTTPHKDESQVLKLRSDPSVASLLNLYDEHGHLPDKAFSNSPPSPSKEGRAQCRRNGSTLRQLLGVSDSDRNNDATEGDISWAERFLGETDSVSTTSSTGPYTPRTTDAQFLGDSFQKHDRDHDITYTTDNDLSSNAPDNPAISSMDVELSISADSIHINDNNQPYQNPDPTTPQRASQVFTFLTSKRQQKGSSMSEATTFPPSAFSTPSDDSRLYSHFSSDSESACANPSASPRIRLPSETTRVDTILDTITDHSPAPIRTSSSSSIPRLHNNVRENGHIPQSFRSDFDEEFAAQIQEAKPRKVKVLMTGPTKVIVTAPTPSQNSETPTRIPRGPRAPPKKTSSAVYKEPRTMLTDRPKPNQDQVPYTDGFTAMPSRRRTPRRSSSQSSRASQLSENSNISNTRPTERAYDKWTKVANNTENRVEKENQFKLSINTPIPLTPLRSNSSPQSRRSLFRTVVHQSMFNPPTGMTPSPASSSELSPVGKQLMLDIRQQRQRARDVARKQSGRMSRHTSLRA